jgi:hypothetical protein
MSYNNRLRLPQQCVIKVTNRLRNKHNLHTNLRWVVNKLGLNLQDSLVKRVRVRWHLRRRARVNWVFLRSNWLKQDRCKALN